MSSRDGVAAESSTNMPAILAAGGSAGRTPGRAGRGPPGRHRRCRRRAARRAAWSTVGRGQGTPSITTSRSEWPGTSTPSRSASVPSRRGVRIVAEDVDQRAGVDRIDMLGVERQAGAGEPVGDAGVDRLQPLDRGEQAERAALRRLDQPRIGAGERGDVAALDVGDDQHLAVGGIIERAGGARNAAAGPVEMGGAGARLGAVPVLRRRAGSPR